MGGSGRVTLWLDARRPGKVAEAAGIIRAGGVVAFPTETVYGLGADGLNAAAVAKVFRAKGRPADNPLILHVVAPEMVREVARDWPALADDLMAHFWPGPLTLVLPRGEAVPPAVSAGLPTVAVRCPAHPVALELIRAVGRPLAAPSANRSGRPSPTTAADVLEDLVGRVDAVLDGGPTGVGVESTVVDVTADPPVVLRPGAVTVEELRRWMPALTVFPRSPEPGAGVLPLGEGPRSPGMKYAHYAPSAPVVVVTGPAVAAGAALGRRGEELLHEGVRVGILATDETLPLLDGLVARGAVVRSMGSRRQPAVIAASLFHHLRSLDREGVSVILVEGIEPVGLGLAVMDRLIRAAREVVRVP